MVWTFLWKLRLNYALAILIALIMTSIVGAIIYQTLLVRIRGMEASEVIGSFAVGLALMEFLRWKGFIGHAYAVPVFIKGATSIGGVPVRFPTDRYCFCWSDHRDLLVAFHSLYKDRSGSESHCPG